MTVALALFRKNLRDSRWMLGVLCLALFWLSWLFVYVAHRIERAMQRDDGARSMRMLRGMGGAAMDFSTTAIEMAFWNHPFILLMVAVWVIARGSGSVAGEIEKGSIDLIMSRPVGRGAFYLTQVASAVFGLVMMIGAMIAGNLIASRYYTLIAPPDLLTLLKPGANLLAFGLAIFGYTAFLSSGDLVRWRPNLIASVVTLAMFVFLVVASIPQLEEWKWLEHITIFKAYNPVEVATKGETLAFNGGILAAIGGVGVVLGLLVFARRDLPAGS